MVGDAAEQVAGAWGAACECVSLRARYGIAAAAAALIAGQADDLATLCPRYLRGDIAAPLNRPR